VRRDAIARVRIKFITTGIIETAWRHGKRESTPSLTNVFRQRTGPLNFFARITSAPIALEAEGYRITTYTDGGPVLRVIWRALGKSQGGCQ